MTPLETAFQTEFCMVFDHQGAIATRIATSRTRFLFRTHRGHQAGGRTCDRQSARFPIALAHGHRANSLFDRVIHRSGDSTCSDHACLMTFPWFWGKMVHHRQAATCRW